MQYDFKDPLGVNNGFSAVISYANCTKTLYDLYEWSNTHGSLT